MPRTEGLFVGHCFKSSVGQLVRVLVTSFGKHGDFERCFMVSFFITKKREKKDFSHGNKEDGCLGGGV